MSPSWALAVGLLVLTFTTPYLLGAAGAYLQIAGAGLCLILLAIERRGLAIPGDPGAKLLLVALALLFIAFVRTADEPLDVLPTLNFGMLVAFGPLSRFLSRFAAPDNIGRVADLALAGSVLAALFALGQVLIGHYPRAMGWETDPIWSAEAAVILGFVAGLGFRRPGHWRVAYLLGPLLGTFTCLLAGSRGPLLALPVLALLIVVGSSRRWWISLLVLIAGTAVLMGGVALLLPAVAHRLTSIGTIGEQLSGTGGVTELSAATRLDFYRSGFAAFLHAPLFGYGWGEKMQALLPYLGPNGPALIAPHRHLHSDILDFGVSAGLLGLIAYLLLLVGPVVAVFRSPRDSQYALRRTGILVVSGGYLICGLTYLMFGYEYHSTLYVCLTAALLGYCRDAAPPQRLVMPEPS